MLYIVLASERDTLGMCLQLETAECDEVRNWNSTFLAQRYTKSTRTKCKVVLWNWK